MTLLDVAVVGAGMAGLACAQRLQRAGYKISVLEKSRGLGGRMATRRVDGVPIDHGARFVQPQGKLLLNLTQQLVEGGILTIWQPQAFYLDSTQQITPDPSPNTYYVAPAGMSSIGKSLSLGLNVQRLQRVVAIAPTPENHWCITAERADDGEAVNHIAKALVLAIPAPQIVPLLEPLRSQPEISDILPAIAAVQYTPCITVLAQYASHNFQRHSPLPRQSTEPWMVEGHADTPFFWVGLDSSKRQMPGINVVLQSSAKFATHWLELSDLQPAGATLLAAAGKLIAPWLTNPMRWQVHRWRYALVEKPCPEGGVGITGPLPLVTCGDWGGDRQIDSALEAGWTAASQINASLYDNQLPDSLAEIISNPAL